MNGENIGEFDTEGKNVKLDIGENSGEVDMLGDGKQLGGGTLKAWKKRMF